MRVPSMARRLTASVRSRAAGVGGLAAAKRALRTGSTVGLGVAVSPRRHVAAVRWSQTPRCTRQQASSQGGGCARGHGPARAPPPPAPRRAVGACRRLPRRVIVGGVHGPWHPRCRPWARHAIAPRTAGRAPRRVVAPPWPPQAHGVHSAGPRATQGARGSLATCGAAPERGHSAWRPRVATPPVCPWARRGWYPECGPRPVPGRRPTGGQGRGPWPAPSAPASARGHASLEASPAATGGPGGWRVREGRARPARV